MYNKPFLINKLNKILHSRWKSLLSSSSRELNIELPYDSEILLLGLYPERTESKDSNR